MSRTRVIRFTGSTSFTAHERSRRTRRADARPLDVAVHPVRAAAAGSLLPGSRVTSIGTCSARARRRPTAPTRGGPHTCHLTVRMSPGLIPSRCARRSRSETGSRSSTSGSTRRRRRSARAPRHPLVTALAVPPGLIVSDSFVIADWSDPGTHPGRPIAGLHLHRSDDEAWVVLEGSLGFRVGESEREVGAGDSLLVTHGTAHSFWNAASEPARYVLVMTPRIHRLVEALHAGDRTDFARSSRSTTRSCLPEASRDEHPARERGPPRGSMDHGDVAHVVVSRLAYAHPGGDLLFSDVSFRISGGQHVGPGGRQRGRQEHAAQAARGRAERRRRRDFGRRHRRLHGAGRGRRRRSAHRPRAVAVARSTARVGEAGRRMLDYEAQLEAGDLDAGIKLGTAIADWSALGGYELEGQWDAPAGGSCALRLPNVADRPAVTLSGGERKQLVLDVLFSSDAEVLLLDEPDNFLDVPAKLELERPDPQLEEDRPDDLPRSRRSLAGAVKFDRDPRGQRRLGPRRLIRDLPPGARGAPAPPRRRRAAVARRGAPPLSG